MTYVRATGSYVPERVVGNEELAALVGESAAWIRDATGIEERRYASEAQGVTDLAVRAAERCLSAAGVEARALGMILVSSGSAERRFPGPAGEVAACLGLTGTPALDIPVPSAGSLIGLAMAMRMAESLGPVLVIGAEIMSRRIERTVPGRNTAILFGDGAGAALVDPSQGGLRLVDAVLHTDGSGADVLYMEGERLVMDGGSVILRASRRLPAVMLEVLQRHGIAAGDVSDFLMHQANLNLMVKVAAALKVPGERFFANIQRYGNTSSASLLIALDEWGRRGPATGPVVLSAFGAGLNWGAVLALPA